MGVLEDRQRRDRRAAVHGGALPVRVAAVHRGARGRESGQHLLAVDPHLQQGLRRVRGETHAVHQAVDGVHGDLGQFLGVGVAVATNRQRAVDDV
ncbi:hypothetical protein CIT14_22010, partial [Virgibacillus profundi]